MQQDIYDKTCELENRYWWYLGRRHIFDNLLSRFFPGSPDKKIVDIGCGTGGVIPMLSKHGQVLGLDIEPRALDFCRSKGFHNVALMENFYDTGQPDESADLVSLFDVLEHFEDDLKALNEINRILKSGGFVFLSVPAFKILWSELDEVAHHRRRYKQEELEQKLKDSGFAIVKSSYVFFFVFPLIFFYRTVARFQKKHLHPQFSYVEFPRLINAFFVTLSKIEAVLLKFINFPFGSSVVVLARKIK